jgi:transposase
MNDALLQPEPLLHCKFQRSVCRAQGLANVAGSKVELGEGNPRKRDAMHAELTMSIPGVGQLTALAFTAAVDDPGRFRRSRDIGAYLGLVPRRYQSGEVDYTGGISKCGDRRVRTLLYEAANVMLTRYKGQLKLKDWALAIAKRSTMRKARIALARRLAIIVHAMLRHGTEFKPA